MTVCAVFHVNRVQNVVGQGKRAFMEFNYILPNPIPHIRLWSLPRFANTNNSVRRGQPMHQPYKLAQQDLQILGLDLNNLKPVQQNLLKTRTTKTYERNPMLATQCRDSANGVCSVCGRTVSNVNNVNFDVSQNIPELQVHHITPLARNGPDVIGNMIAICPDCHRRIHLAPQTTQIPLQPNNPIERNFINGTNGDDE